MSIGNLLANQITDVACRAGIVVGLDFDWDAHRLQAQVLAALRLSIGLDDFWELFSTCMSVPLSRLTFPKDCLALAGGLCYVIFAGAALCSP